MKHYDAIVIGCGGVGSAALWRLAQRGRRVLGIDRFCPPHSQGSTHGQTRIIRQAYFEHPDYVPLARRAYALWEELEGLTGERLMERTGLLQVGPHDGAVLSGVRRSAAEHGLTIEELNAQEVAHRWPAFRVPNELSAIHEPAGGFLHVERCVEACLTYASSLGADTVFDTPVEGWSGEHDSLVVHTQHESFVCDRLIITAGPWAAQSLGGLDLGLQLRRKSLFWFSAPEGHDPQRMPPYLFELSDGVYYGFPAIDDLGVKVGDHSLGQLLATPEEINREVVPEEEQAVRGFLKQCLPGVSTRRTSHSTCYYTMSPDEHFIVDRHPDDPRVAFAAGLSGHGFKFTPVLGETLADLALLGETELPVGFLRMR